MRTMKDSGIEWIGEIPLDWGTSKMRYIGQYINGYAFKPDDWSSEGKRIIRIQDLTGTNNNPNYYAGQLPDKYNVTAGDILVSWAATLDAFIWNNDDAWLNQHIFKAICFPKVIDKNFFFWVLKEAMENMNNDNKHGIVMQHITLSVFSNFTIPLPPKLVQRRIANYLDRKCGQIDTIIARQQEVIEKLKAYKLSVITEAATKGLNPDTPMKDSGVEWIGEIPEYWQLSHIGNLVEMGSGGTPDRKKPEYWENGNIPWMSSGEINDEYIYSTTEHITELGLQNSNAKILPVNTVMLGLIGQGKTKGLTAILKTEVCCNQNLAYLIADEKYLHYRYLFYCFKAMYFYIRGLVGESQAGIYSYFLKKLHIPLPDIEQQIRISDYLDAKCEAIKSSINKRERIIEKLTGYKKSLIYEVVTGKKEV
ncbi:restriction endonuclease subunit S [uncultured Ruthenibacterium sp.]|uniref:restriction endonuclease subunit S n=1 Tax=uncultured Ruthenibacterium sp. TaxID=1905347 RepID=UPI00349E678A